MRWIIPKSHKGAQSLIKKLTSDGKPSSAILITSDEYECLRKSSLLPSTKGVTI